MNFIYAFFSILFKKNNVIFLESSPDMSSNTYPVFLQFLKKGYNKKYIFVWKIRNKKILPKYRNVFYWNEQKKYSFIMKVFFHFIFKNIKINICCNGFLLPKSDKQISFYLTHGTFIKNVINYYNIPKEINYVLVASKEAGKIISKTANFPYPNRIVATGYPYNDDLTNTKIDLDLLFNKKYSKYIVWYPTYKQHKNSTAASTSGKAVCIIDKFENANEINQTLIQNNTLLIVKPHFAQDNSKIIINNFSNIIFINDEFFEKNNITSYSFVGSCDALITDYSAIYFDYLLCNKQIGVVWEDIKEYEQFPGFCVDIQNVMKPTFKIFNKVDFIEFIKNVADENDQYKGLRNLYCQKYNISKDGKNAERVTNFIIKTCNLKL